MEMHQLRYVVAIARTGNFSRAAEHCHVSQPSLSQQIQKLEEELGERLFDRMKRTTKLTPAGAAFVRRAVTILEEVDNARREVSDARGLLRGTVIVGAIPTLAPYVLPGALATFTRKFPGVEIVVQEETTDRLLRLVHSYDVDVAVLTLPVPEDRLEVRRLFADELLLALPPGHPLARERRIDPAQLGGERLIVMKEGHCLGDQVLGFCERQDVSARITFRSAQLETIRAMVGAGLGVSLVPRMAVPRGVTRGVEYRPFRDPRPERQLVVLWPRQRPPGRAAAEFVKVLEGLRPRR